MQKIILPILFLSSVLLSACQSYVLSADSHSQSSSTNQSVWIAKDLGLKQCEQTSGQDALDRAQQTLNQNKLKVLAAHCADDGMMRIQVCGASQGTMGIYKIEQKQLPLAKSLGFKQVQARQYQQVPCS